MLGRQLYFELFKLFARPRTFLGFGAFLAVEGLILGMLHLPAAKKGFDRFLNQNGYGFENYYSGLSLAFVMVTYTAVFLGSLFLALVAGDMIAKEAEEGTLRMTLCRPVSRLRIYLVKYAATFFYTVVLMVFIVASSVGMGILLNGWGGMLVYDPWEGVFGIYDAGEGLGRFLLAMALLSFLALSISGLGLMFSSFDMKPATAAILTLVVVFSDKILHIIPYFDSYDGYLLSHHMAAWIQVFQPRIPWERVMESMLYLGAFDLSFLLLGGLVFCGRNFKS